MEYLETYWLISKYLGGGDLILLLIPCFIALQLQNIRCFVTYTDCSLLNVKLFYGLPFGLGTS